MPYVYIYSVQYVHTNILHFKTKNHIFTVRLKNTHIHFSHLGILFIFIYAPTQPHLAKDFTKGFEFCLEVRTIVKDLLLYRNRTVLNSEPYCPWGFTV